MMVPFPPGGLTDVVGRLIAEGMRTALGQTIIIENVGGATGSIGTGGCAAPDGYTITVGIWNTHVANGITYAAVRCSQRFRTDRAARTHRCCSWERKICQRTALRS